MQYSDYRFKYQHITESLKQEILAMPPGTKLAGRNLLAKQHGVSRITIEAAISQLIEAGLLISVKGSGTFISNEVRIWQERKNKADTLEKSLSGIQRTVDSKKVFAVLISNIISDIYPALLRGIEDVANLYGISIMVCNTDNLVSKQEQYIKRLIKNSIDGIILVPAINGSYNLTIFEELRRNNIPVISCYRPIPGMYTTGIFCNSFYAGYLATKQLIQSGCRKIAYLSLPVYASAFDRHQGYMAALQEAGLQYDPDLVLYDSDYDSNAVGENTAEILLKQRADVDGIFAFNDRIAVGIYRILERMGLMPGRDIKIVGCDNTMVCTSLPVSLTSISFPIYDLGVEAAKLLLQMLQGSGEYELPIKLLMPEIILRESCK